MKVISKLTLVIMLGTVSQFATAAGHRVGNGGHSVASHFSTIAENISMVWEDTCKNKKDTNAFCEYLPDFKKALNKDSPRYVKIKAEEQSEAADHTCQIDESVRQACNDGKNLIVINANAWREINDNASLINLVLHELFSVLELDSSDHYQYSMKVYSMLKHKGFELSKLARHEALPNPCSIKINENSDEQKVKSLIVSELEQKRYSLKDRVETTRYELNIATKCKSGTLSVTCGVYSQLKDNYTDKEVFTDMQVASGIRNRAHKLFGEMKAKIMGNIDACNM